MRPSSEVELEIDAVSDERRDAQRAGEMGRMGELDGWLSDLYEELRTARARERYGTREEIAQRARVERELEKLSRPEA